MEEVPSCKQFVFYYAHSHFTPTHLGHMPKTLHAKVRRQPLLNSKLAMYSNLKNFSSLQRRWLSPSRVLYMLCNWPYKAAYPTWEQVESGKASVNICQIHLHWKTKKKKKPLKKQSTSIIRHQKLIGLLVVASKRKKKSDF
jgi:hypothetical protein